MSHKHEFRKVKQIEIAGKLYDYYECAVKGCTAMQFIIAKGQLGPIRKRGGE